MSKPTILTIQATECIGNSLNTINTNYRNLKISTDDNDDRIGVLESQTANLQTRTVPLTAYNTLIRTLTAFAAAPATTYATLSTQFRTLSALTV